MRGPALALRFCNPFAARLRLWTCRPSTVEPAPSATFFALHLAGGSCPRLCLTPYTTHGSQSPFPFRCLLLCNPRLFCPVVFKEYGPPGFPFYIFECGHSVYPHPHFQISDIAHGPSARVLKNKSPKDGTGGYSIL